jgi:hypothetical protein
MGMTGACVGSDPRLFDSTRAFDHLLARRVCATCPMVQACIGRAIAIASQHPHNPHWRGPDGTWGGLLWHAGVIVDLRLNVMDEAAA